MLYKLEKLQRLKIFKSIRELLTLRAGAAKDGRHISEPDLSPIQNAAMIARGGQIVWIGREAELSKELIGQWGDERSAEIVDLGNRTVLPGFTECHTHLVFAGDRSQEFEWRQSGMSYQEIYARGGGILSTVSETRKASHEQLLLLAQTRADRFAAQGVTTLEVKSGYGLNLETERKILEVARKIRGPHVVTTFLGAHSRSPDFSDLAAYMTEIINRIMPEIAREKLADRVDIYVEKGFFEHALAKDYFEAARGFKLPITAHVEQLSVFGGTDLALDFEPQSVDHVVFVEPKTIDRLARSKASAVLLPASDFYLKMRYPPARALIDAGARVALSTDFNPGTSPTQDLSLVGVLARVEMKMSLAETIGALTVGAAAALGRLDSTGSLEVGKSCDFTVFDDSWRALFYSVGQHPVKQTYVRAELITK